MIIIKHVIVHSKEILLNLHKKCHKILCFCRVSVFGPSPLQWTCREWVQKLSFDKATACFGGEKYTEPDGSTSQGERAPRPRMGTPNSSRIPRASLLSLGLSPTLGDLCCYIFLSSVHPPPTLVNHPCPYSSAHPIGHSFWRSVSCCGPPLHCPGVTSTSMGSEC